MKYSALALTILLSAFCSAGIADNGNTQTRTYDPVLKVKPQGLKERAGAKATRKTPPAEPATPGTVQKRPETGIEPDEIDRK